MQYAMLSVAPVFFGYDAPPVVYDFHRAAVVASSAAQPFGCVLNLVVKFAHAMPSS
jgi:hypothetical protein